MVPLVDEDEEIEAASFMPPAFRTSDDSALRKWRAGDIVTKALDAQIGGGTFGETQNNKVFRATRSDDSIVNHLDTIEGLKP